jgi:hypothetical protein
MLPVGAHVFACKIEGDPWRFCCSEECINRLIPAQIWTADPASNAQASKKCRLPPPLSRRILEELPCRDMLACRLVSAKVNGLLHDIFAARFQRFLESPEASLTLHWSGELHQVASVALTLKTGGGTFSSHDELLQTLVKECTGKLCTSKVSEEDIHKALRVYGYFDTNQPTTAEAEPGNGGGEQSQRAAAGNLMVRCKFASVNTSVEEASHSIRRLLIWAKESRKDLRQQRPDPPLAAVFQATLLGLVFREPREKVHLRYATYHYEHRQHDGVQLRELEGATLEFSDNLSCTLERTHVHVGKT